MRTAAKFGDRATLSDELWLLASQVSMLLGRSQDQLAEDRKVGNPPPFKKESGSVRYRLGTVRDYMMGAPEYSTTQQARLAANNNFLFSSFDSWINQAKPDDQWPCLIHHRDGPIDFWLSLTLGDQLSDEDRCEWLRHEDFLALRAKSSQNVASRAEFLEFLDEVGKLHDTQLTPLRIASAPFDKIYAHVHLVWIRDQKTKFQQKNETATWRHDDDGAARDISLQIVVLDHP